MVPGREQHRLHLQPEGAYRPVPQIDGAGAEDLLYADTSEKYPVSWSRDGKSLLYISTSDGVTGDLWLLPMASEQGGTALKPQPFLKSSAFGQFSPDGQWVSTLSIPPSVSKN